MSGLPAELKAAIDPIKAWMEARRIDPLEREQILYFLSIQRALAPKTWKIGTPPVAGVYDADRKSLPVFPVEDIPYSLASIQWAIQQLNSEQRDLRDSFKTTQKRLPSQYGLQSTSEVLASFPVELFRYDEFVTAEEKAELDKYLLNTASPAFGRALLGRSARERNPNLQIVPSPLSISPISSSLSFKDIIDIWSFSQVPTMQPLTQSLHGLANVSRSLAAILKFRGQNVPDIDFNDSWNAYGWFWKQPQIEEALMENVAIFQPYSDLVHLYNVDQAFSPFSSIVSQLPPANEKTTDWLIRQFRDKWAGDIWLGYGDSFFATTEALEAIYSIGCQWYSFEPQLHLYLFPEQGQVIGEFWDKYGDAILVLQELAQAYQNWTEKDQEDRTKVCGNIINRFGSSQNVDRLRSLLWQLEQHAAVESVPLRFLFDTRLPVMKNEMIAGAVSFEHGILLDYEIQVKRMSDKSMRSSLWWFDTLRVWWDVVCKDYLSEKMKEIIQFNSPLESQEQQINEAVSQGLIVGIGEKRLPGKRRVGLKLINSTSLSSWKKQEAKKRLEAILATPAAVNQIELLDVMVRDYQITPEVARLDLEELINRFI
jgi:hypothetical protein